jgi:Flp pilus assembly pilin Flp
MMRIINTIRGEMNAEHAGAVAFEYVIILVIMAVAIFTAWGILSNQIITKANEISTFIANNGTTSMGTTSAADTSKNHTFLN